MIKLARKNYKEKKKKKLFVNVEKNNARGQINNFIYDKGLKIIARELASRQHRRISLSKIFFYILFIYLINPPVTFSCLLVKI